MDLGFCSSCGNNFPLRSGFLVFYLRSLLGAQGDAILQNVSFTENIQKGYDELHDGGQLSQSDFNSSF